MTRRTPQQRWLRAALALLTPNMKTLARRLRVHPVTLRAYKRGARGPSAKVTARLARLLRTRAVALRYHAAQRPR